ANETTLPGLNVDNFIAKLDNDGNFLWAKIYRGKNNSTRIISCASSFDSYYFGGHYRDSLFTTNDTLINNGTNTDIFIFKTDYNGVDDWNRKIVGTANDFSTKVATDINNDVYLSGYFTSPTLQIDSTDADFSLVTISNNGSWDNVIFKYSSSGILQWLNSQGDAGGDIFYGLTSRNNRVLVTGQFAGQIIYDNDTIKSSGTADVDAFFVSFDLNGNILESKDITGVGFEDVGVSCSIDKDDNYLVTGYYNSDPIYFYSDVDAAYNDTLYNTLVGSKDMFIAKYGCQAVALSFILDSVNCAGGNDGQVVIQPSIADNYIYSWTGGFPDNDTITSVAEGWYYVTVTNPRGCMYIDSVEMVSKPPLQTSMLDSITINCIAGNDGVATVTAIDGVGPFTYAWSVSSSTTATASDLTVGQHIVTVTDFCGFVEDTVNVGYMPTLSTSMSSHSILVLCETSTDGEATVTPVNGVGPFAYQWTDGIVTTATNATLTVGMHYVTVTDVCNVPTVDSVRVNYLPTMNASITESENTTCINSSDGEGYIFATAGVPPYTFSWSDGTNAAFTNTLDTGWAYVTVTDFCISIVDSVLISSQPAMTIDISSYVDVTCTGLTNGQATVTVTNGVGPYTYVWSGSLLTTAYVDDLDTGWVYVTVNDVCGALTDSVHIGISTNLTTTMSSHTILVLCETSMDGEATVTAVNGVPPITYNWTNGVTSAYNNTLPTGMNYVTVNDACGIAVIDYVLVNYMPAMNASITESASTSCINSSDGYAYIFATSGVPPYNYAWSDLTSAASTITLDTGWAYVTVSDYCISIIDSVLIGSNPAMTIDITAYQDVSCPGYTDGEATVTALYGAPPYYYAWAGSMSTNASVNDLAVGWQAVTVTDGCGFLSDSVFIGTMPTLVLSLDQVAPATCSYSTDGAALVTTSNGTPPFTYAWSGSLSTDSNAVDLAVGMQIVTVTDGCGSYNDTVMITYRTPLAAGYSSVNILCNNDTTGGIIVTPVNGVLPYSYAWSVAGTDSTVENLGAGTYSYTVTDFCGSVTGSVILTEPGALSASFIVTNESFTGMGDGKIDLIISGGEAPYDYLWSNEATTEDIYNLNEGEFSVTITDYNNCTLIDTVEIETEYNYIEIMNAFTPNGDGTNDTWTIKYIDQYPGCHVDVFNQWGMNVFSSTGYLEKWNGKKNNSGSNLPSAAYYYIIDLGDGTDQYTGSVTIIR
ncbi:MAG: gliding motility-associated C-terminal domain-containing protein, partial [Bacteroidota bacterium]